MFLFTGDDEFGRVLIESLSVPGDALVVADVLRPDAGDAQLGAVVGDGQVRGGRLDQLLVAEPQDFGRRRALGQTRQDQRIGQADVDNFGRSGRDFRRRYSTTDKGQWQLVKEIITIRPFLFLCLCKKSQPVSQSGRTATCGTETFGSRFLSRPPLNFLLFGTKKEAMTEEGEEEEEEEEEEAAAATATTTTATIGTIKIEIN